MDTHAPDARALAAAVPALQSTRPGFTPIPGPDRDPVAVPPHAAPAGTALNLVRPSPDEMAGTLAGWFDADHYRAAYPDVAGSGLEPLQHFILRGASEQRDPARWFDTPFYLHDNPDVLATGFNPFWHYVVQGRAQGRPPRPRRVAEREAFRHALPGPARNPPHTPSPMACLLPPSLMAALEPCLTGAASVTLAVSHDRYARSVGGVQILVSDEQLAFNARQGAYLHIAPVTPRLALAPEAEAPFYVHATLDGRYVGVTTYGDLAAVLAGLRPRLPEVRQLVLHCVLGHQLRPLAALHDALAPQDAVFWVNDYESICPGYNLLRNDAAFCGAPPPDSFACRVCVYGPERAEHLRQFAGLFAAVPLHVVAPSPAALAVWQAGSLLPHRSAQVHAYAEVRPADPAPAPDAPAEAGPPQPVRAAFVGMPVAHKGWHAFAALAARIEGMPEYRLFHFTSHPPGQALPGVETVPARVGPDQRGAMTEALLAHGIQLVLALSPWPETFCLVAYEALAAGADVVALRDGGNVPDLVLRTGRGVVAADADELIRFFLFGGAARYARLAAAGERSTGRLVSRGMTATLPRPGGGA